jgi:hypothetical protein
MRSTQKDADNFIICGSHVSDAASGSGLMQPGGIPFVFTRTGTGQYLINFDSRITPIHIEATGQSGASPWALPTWLPGAISIIAVNASGAPFNSDFRFSVTAFDKRK